MTNYPQDLSRRKFRSVKNVRSKRGIRKASDEGGTQRIGLTLLEVIFAMAIILFGLVGIGLLVPYAARQANESQTITYSLANGMSASAMMKSSSLLTPTEESPWQIIDDSYPVPGDSIRSVFTSFRELYTGIDRNGNPLNANNLFLYQYFATDASGNPSQRLDYPQNQDYVDIRSPDHAWININRALGTCFYLDPNFWGQQAYVTPGKLNRSSWSPFRRNRFPYYAENYFPSPATTAPTPKLWRVSLRDTNMSGSPANNGWMKSSAAKALTSSYGGEIEQFTTSTAVNVPVRNFLVKEDPSSADIIPLIKSGTGLSRFGGSWGIMICPDEDTPIVPKSQVRLIPPKTSFQDFKSPFFPELYNVSLVLYAKRDVGELTPTSSLVTGFPTRTVLPEAEKIASVTSVVMPSGDIDNQSMTSGNFEIVLNASSELNAKIVAGDWIMLSRYVMHFEPPPASGIPYALRQRHRWYRVVSAPSSTTFPLTLRVAGVPWDWTNDEIRSAREAGVANLNSFNPINPLSIYYPLTQTTATIVPHVVHVYQRTYSLGK